jgi:hypothetical protein
MVRFSLILLAWGRLADPFCIKQDAVNRRISMKMMVDTAKAANGVQFILITPQDMGVSGRASSPASREPS